MQASQFPNQKFLDTYPHLSRALNCLLHPSSLISILILLFNDFVVKYQWPSWLSGKLSDFAGLYFFPFLLAMLISLLPGLRFLSSGRIGKISICITVVWFVLVKLSPIANRVTSELLESFAGSQSVIVLDPSDVIAIVVLIPTWFLWKSMNRPWPGWRALPVLLVTAFATMATSCPYYGKITKLTVYDGDIYLYTEIHNREVWRSIDNGLTWQHADHTPESVLDDFRHNRELPVVECYTDNPSICYRTTGNETIERSNDGGSTYQIVWRTPSGRRNIMDRYYNHILSFCSKQIDIGPYDLKLLGSSKEPLVVAAAGNEGIILGSTISGWERIPAAEADPSPYSYLDLQLIALMTFKEGMILAIVGILYTVVISWTNLNLAVGLAGENVELSVPRIKAPVRYSLLFFAVTFPVVLIWIASFFFAGFIFGYDIILGFGVIASIWFVVGFAVSWRRLSRSLGEKKNLRRIPVIGLVNGLCIFPMAWAPFGFWVAGIIPWYQLAVILSFSCLIFALFIGYRGRRKIQSAFETGSDCSAMNKNHKKGIST